MSKTEFLERLQELLLDIPEEERREALKYYRNYFEDAGEEREEQVLKELGSPERVAAQIKEGLKEDSREEGYFTERGYEDDRFSDRQRIEPYRRRRSHGSAWKVLGIIFLCIFAIPMGIPVLCTVFGGIVAVLAVVFSVGLSVFVLTFVGFFAGIVFLCAGFGSLIANPGAGVLLCGVGFLGIAVGILLLLASGWMVRTGIPGFCRGVSHFTGKLFRRRGGERV